MKKGLSAGKAGFTLIETIIYTALLAFLMGAGISAAFYIIDSSQKNKADINVQAEGNFILRKIEWAMNGASAAGVSGGELSITKPSLPVGQNPLKFSLSGANMQLARGSGAAVSLNSPLVAVSGVVFSYTPSSGKVTADFSVNGKAFSLTKYLRK